MGAFFTAILSKIVNFAKWFIAVFKQLFLDAWNFCTDIVCWAFDGFLGLAVSALEALQVPFDPATYYAMIPADVANMLGLIQVPQALSIIVAAIVVRFLLQTIPFVRWGS